MVGKSNGEQLGAFIWGAGGAKLTPEQIAIRRIANQKRLAGGVDTSPVQHWTQGAARVAEALADVVEQRRLASAQTESDTYNTDLVNSILGGSSTPSASSASTSSAPVAAVDPASLNVDPSIREGIISTAQSLGIDPVDLGTAISYETGGTFDPVKRGPTTQWGQHRGLIQFGEPQAKEYGVDWNNPVGSQLGENGAVANYLRKAGVEPGMGMLDIYSAINAGRVGRYNASDANNGGAPGTVRDKVEQQMGGHRAKALALLGSSQPPQSADPSVASLEQSIGTPFVASMSPPDPAAEARQQELMTQVVGTPTAFSDPMVNAQGAQAAIDAQMTPQVDAQPMAPELPPPTTIAPSPAVAQVAQAMPSAPQQQSGGVNQALIRALSDPRANDQTRAIAEILIRQDQARQQAAQEQSVWQQRQEYERQQQANDPLRQLQIRKAQMEIDSASQPQRQPLINAGNGAIYDPNAGSWIQAPNTGQEKTPDSVRALELRAERAGLKPGTPEYNQFMISGGSGGTSLSVGPNGEVSFQQGGAVKPLTEAQSKDAVFSARATNALPLLNKYEDALLSLPESAAGAIPMNLGNYAQSEEYQVARDAGRDFLATILRKDTGAAITDNEEKIYGQMFLPQPGDKPATIQAKRQRRSLAVEAIKAGMPTNAIENMAKALQTVPASTDVEVKTDIPGVVIRRKN